MSNLTPQKRPDRNGKMVTRHVLAATPTTAAKVLPAPSTPAVTNSAVFQNDDFIRESLYLYMPEDQADEYFSFVLRKPKVIQSALAMALTAATDEKDVRAALAVVEEITDRALAVIALDDLDFLIAMARPPYGETNVNEGKVNEYTGAITVMQEAFRVHFKRDALNPETIDLDKYGPFLRAATITRALGLDDRTPTTLDAVIQRQHVSDHLDTFTGHYPALIKVAQATNRSAAPMDSRIMLEVCTVLEQRPESIDALVTYLGERERFDLSEFKAIIEGPANALAQGTL